MRKAQVVLQLAIKQTVLAVLVVFTLLVMLWVLVLAEFLVVRAHLFLCVLAYYLEWHMCQRLLPAVVVRG
jgi:hypothetical protein